MTSRPSHVSRRRRRRRRRRLIRISIAAGSVLLLSASVALAVVRPPEFLTSADETPPPPPVTVTVAAPTTVAPTETLSASPSPSPSPTAEAPPVRLAIAGDTGTRNQAEDATARRMEADGKNDPFAALLLLGDIVYENGDAQLARQSVLTPFGGVLRTAKLIAVLGNHDIQSSEQKELMHVLGRDSAWYVEQVGRLRVIVLDSNHVGSAQQTAWLRGVLAEKQPPGTWTIAAMHHPAYSAGMHGSSLNVRRAWSPLFERAGIRLVLAGHDHDYQRSLPQNGITYVVSGAGAKLRKTGHKNFTAVSASTRHYLDLRVFEDRLEGRAVAQDGHVIDSFTIKR